MKPNNKSNNISVVLPNFNHAKELKISLQALCCQTTPPAEIIVVDDGSTDHSLEVIRDFENWYPMLKLIRNKTNKGVAYSVKRGVEIAQCPYILMASADEMLASRMVEKMTEAITLFPKEKLFISNFAEWYAEEELILDHDKNSELGQWYKECDKIEFLSPTNLHNINKKGTMALQATTALFDKNALIDAGVYDEKMKWLGDWLTMHYLAFKHGVVVIPETLSYFRRSQISFSGKNINNIKSQEIIFDYFFKKLQEPKYKDFYNSLIISPGTMSPFLNTALRYAVKNLFSYRLCRAIVSWWIKQFLLGKRPGKLKQLIYGNKNSQKLREFKA